MLANGMEIRSLRELEPAINNDPEWALCAQRVEENTSTATILFVVSAVLFAGGSSLGTAGFLNNRSLVLGGLGSGVAAIGLTIFTVGVLGPGRGAERSLRRGLTLYEPLLRQRLGINPPTPSIEAPSGEVEECR